MTTLLALLIVAIGLTIVINTSRKRGTGSSEFPRHHEPVATGPRYLSVLLGVIITLCGGSMLVISHLD